MNAALTLLLVLRLDGHRGFWGQAFWGLDKWYSIDEAYGHIEGVSPDRSKYWQFLPA